MLRIKNHSALAQGAGLALFGLVIVCGSLVVWCIWQHHFWTARKGPTAVALADLAKIESPKELPSTWVELKYEKAFDTKHKIEEINKRGNKVIVAKYLLLPAGDHWLVAVVPAAFAGNVISGEILLPKTEDNKNEFAAIQDEFEEVHQGKLLPFEFQYAPDYGTTWTYFAIVVAMFGTAGIVFALWGSGGIYRGLWGPAPVSEAEIRERTTAVVDDTIARIMQSARAQRKG
jgi:hypothetical protein